MKKVIVMIAVLMAATTSYAQETTTNDEIELLQNVYGKSKSDLVKEYMKLDGDQALSFQKVYDDYEIKREEIGKTRLNLINNYAENFHSLTDEKADELAKATLKNNLALGKLYSKTYSKAKSAAGAVNAAKFIQLEEYLETIIKSSFQESIPLIGELGNSKI